MRCFQAIALVKTGEAEPLRMAEPLADQIADGEHLTLTQAVEGDAEM
jgi:hypothetical protein